MAEAGGGDYAKRQLVAKPSHSWSHIASEHEERALANRRRELREYAIPISVLNLDPADRKVIRIAGKVMR